MTTGQAVSIALYNANGDIISNPVTKLYSASQRQQSLVFNISPTTGSVQEFEDFYMVINPQGGVAIERVALYATPFEDISQS